MVRRMRRKMVARVGDHNPSGTKKKKNRPRDLPYLKERVYCMQPQQPKHFKIGH